MSQGEPRQPGSAAMAAMIFAAVTALSLDLLVRDVAAGVNLYFAGLLLFGVVLLLRAARLVSLPRSPLRLLGVATLCLGSFAWRDSEALNLLAVLGCLVVGGLAAYRAQGGRLAPAGFLDYLVAVVRAGAGTAVGVLPLVHHEVAWRNLATDSSRNRLVSVGRGLVLALPPVMIFSALFASADPVFKNLYQGLFHVDMDVALSHAAVLGVGAWVGGGYARELFLVKRDRPLPVLTGRFGFTEIRIVLSAVVFVFLLFAAIQLNVLFGGTAFVEAHTNLTYADYARQGFFDLVAVAALVLPLLLLADWASQRNANQDREFRALAAVLLSLLGVVLVSALQRMRLYQLSFGLTEQRVYTMAFMVWLALVLAWLGATVLRGRRERFIPGAALLGLVVIAALHFLNPDRLIAGVNLKRAVRGLRFDVPYVTGLSDDAAPEIVRLLPAIPPEARCQVSHRLLRTAGRDAGHDWRSWNLSRARARDLVAENIGQLRTWSAECDTRLPKGR